MSHIRIKPFFLAVFSIALSLSFIGTIEASGGPGSPFQDAISADCQDFNVAADCTLQGTVNVRRDYSGGERVPVTIHTCSGGSRNNIVCFSDDRNEKLSLTNHYAKVFHEGNFDYLLVWGPTTEGYYDFVEEKLLYAPCILQYLRNGYCRQFKLSISDPDTRLNVISHINKFVKCFVFKFTAF